MNFFNKITAAVNENLDDVKKSVSATSTNVLSRVDSLVKGDEHASAFPTFCITFRRPDIVTVLHANEIVEKILIDVLNEMRRGCVEKKLDTANEHAISLQIKGDPFSPKCADDDEVIHIRRVCCVWLERLAEIGWHPTCTADLSLDDGLSSWFFEYTPLDDAKKLMYETAKDDEKPDVIALAIHESDHLLLVNGVTMHGEACRDSIGDENIQKEERLVTGDYRFKIRGNPWDPTAYNAFEDGMRGRRILLDAFKTYASYGYGFYSSNNLQATADTLYFLKYPAWYAKHEANGAIKIVRSHHQDDAVQPLKFAMLSLNGKDRVRFIDLPNKTCQRMMECIEENWPKGIQSTETYDKHNATEFKLKGNQWCCRGDEALAARLLIANLLQALSGVGYHTDVALDVSNDEDDKSVFILRPRTTTLEKPHCCIAPIGKNKLHLINAPRDTLMEIKERVRIMLKANLESDQPIKGATGCHEFVLKGSPWQAANQTEWIMARHVITVFLAVFKKMGWKCVASADIAAMREIKGTPSDTHTLFFRQEKIIG